MKMQTAGGHTESQTVCFGRTPLTIEDIVRVAHHGAGVEISGDAAYRRHIEAGAEFLDRLLAEEGTVYGVTTGYGDSCTRVVPGPLVNQLPLQLLRFHGCGLGATLSPALARAVVAVRLQSLAQGYSGVSWGLLERLAALLNADVMPVIPEEGSVGASGDLTPLSYLAALLVGERKAYVRGVETQAMTAHDELGIAPLVLRPKEGLAIMNGTAVMTALACDAYARAEYLTRLCSRLTSLACLALHGNRYHFDHKLFSVKPHPGQMQIADWIRQDLHVGEPPRNSNRLQDRYSIRCAPHVIGVLRDSLMWMRQFIEIELNSANDNPIVDTPGQHVLHGGHFYGGHIAFAMDSMKNCVANLADLMDRQLALLVDVKFNDGLPSNLSGAAPDRIDIAHGFKAVQIAVSAWTAEALKLTMPASVFSRSTECHNQDKVSMGTIAARDCLRVLQLTEQAAAAHTLATVQALRLRGCDGDRTVPVDELDRNVRNFADGIAADFPFLEDDRALDVDLLRFVTKIQQRAWPLYEP